MLVIQHIASRRLRRSEKRKSDTTSHSSWKGLSSLTAITVRVPGLLRLKSHFRGAHQCTDDSAAVSQRAAGASTKSSAVRAS